MTFRLLSAPSGLVVDLPVTMGHTEDPTNLFKIAKRRGFTPIFASELADALAGRRGLPPQPVMFIFDDGDASWFTTLHPAVVAYNVKVNCAVVSDYLTNGTLAVFGSNPAITWSQAQSMHATGLYDWLNHTKDHSAGVGASSGVRQASLQDCQDAIYANLGVTPRGVVYPNNSYSAGLFDDMHQMGFELGFWGGTDRSNVFPGSGPFSLTRTDIGNLLKWARQRHIYNHENDMTGGRNAANVLGYWTIPAQGALANSGQTLQITATSTQASRSFITTDYFHVAAQKIFSYCSVTGASRSAGTATVKIKQYDASQSALTDITIATVTTNGTTVYDTDYALDSACEFVRLELATDATYNGTVTVSNWQVRTV